MKDKIKSDGFQVNYKLVHKLSWRAYEYMLKTAWICDTDESCS